MVVRVAGWSRWAGQLRTCFSYTDSLTPASTACSTPASPTPAVAPLLTPRILCPRGGAALLSTRHCPFLSRFHLSSPFSRLPTSSTPFLLCSWPSIPAPVAPHRRTLYREALPGCNAPSLQHPLPFPLHPSLHQLHTCFSHTDFWRTVHAFTCLRCGRTDVTDARERLQAKLGQTAGFPVAVFSGHRGPLSGDIQSPSLSLPFPFSPLPPTSAPPASLTPTSVPLHGLGPPRSAPASPTPAAASRIPAPMVPAPHLRLPHRFLSWPEILAPVQPGMPRLLTWRRLARGLGGVNGVGGSSGRAGEHGEVGAKGGEGVVKGGY
ncbi:unnamed protein product [Closterium sp. NIES-65]|nr:unnamed protein product [Closterium sp. NIES-65]